MLSLLLVKRFGLVFVMFTSLTFVLRRVGLYYILSSFPLKNMERRKDRERRERGQREERRKDRERREERIESGEKGDRERREERIERGEKKG